MYRTSYSRVNTFIECPFRYSMHYIRGMEVPFDCKASNALALGTMLHEYIELGGDEAKRNYMGKFYVLDDWQIDEMIKIDVLGAKMAELLPEGEYERRIDMDGFVGFIDLLVPNGDGSFDMYDFKYSNNVTTYTRSRQLSVYKFFAERKFGIRINRMFFAICPKISIKRKPSESIEQFRIRIVRECEKASPKLYEVEYEPHRVAEFLADSLRMANATTFDKRPSRNCGWCDYQEFCEKGNDIMILPKNERRAESVITDPDMWIYADSYVGKSTFVDKIDNVIFANTDGNTENITSPFVSIKDEYVTEGRMTSRVLAWEQFKDFVDELAKHDNTFEVVALDLIEDLYEHCRFYIFDKLGIRHESDGGYGKGWDMVRTEFLGTIKHLKSLGYRVIYISKELTNEITYANGLKVTTFKPNIADKVANVLAGTVTMTLRAYMNERGHFLQLKKNENIFGGGRIDFKRDYCDLDVDDFQAALIEAQNHTRTSQTRSKDKKGENATARKATPETEPQNATESDAVNVELDSQNADPVVDDKIANESIEQAPAPRVRKRMRQ